MSRSSQDILDHADDLARRFEGYERMRRMKYEEYSLRRAFSIKPAVTAKSLKPSSRHSRPESRGARSGRSWERLLRLPSSDTVLLSSRCDVMPAGAELVPNRLTQPGTTHHQLAAVRSCPDVDDR
jgi:hypothetical protein